MSEPSKKGCKDCNKSTLALLLLRPSPIALAEPLVPVGTQGKVTSDDGLVKGLIPARVPIESRTVLRLLRTGYVYVYLPAPPPGIKNWLVYRVTDNADLIPETSAEFKKMPMPAVCSSSGHNAIGMRLLGIPRAAEISSVWIAYSANLWNDTLKTQNAANPQAMQLLPLGAASVHSFAPTAANLQSKVLECAVPKLQVNGDTVHDFPFNSLAKNVDALSGQLQRAAACHPKTTGKELAVVLADPVGYATELNGLRLRRHALAQQEMEKPENAHPLNSSNALMGLKQVILDVNMGKSWETVSPVMGKGAFEDIMRVKPNPRGWPEGTQWFPQEVSPGNPVRSGFGTGYVMFPDHEERAAAWARKQSAATWAAMAKHYSEADRLAWNQKFESRMQSAHYEPLAKFEADWWEARKDGRFNDYFKLHFDENDPNRPHSPHSPGLVYTKEVTLATTPAPLTLGKVLTEYLDELSKEITEPTAVMQRALVANQAELFPKVQAVIDVNASLAFPHLHEKRNDKLYDLGAGVLAGAANASAPNAAQKLVVKYGWLTAVLGDALGGYTMVIAQSLNGALMGVAAGRGGLEFAKSAQGKELLNRLQAVQMVQRAIDMALQSVVSGGPLKTPMQITKRYPVHKAMLLLAGRDGVSRAQIRKSSKGGFVDVSLLTDNHEMSNLGGSMDDAIAQGAGRVELPAQPKAALLKTPTTLGMLTLSETQFSQLWRARANLSARAAEAVKESISGGWAVIRSLDGRLALGVILINGVGLKGTLDDLGSADAKKVRDAWVGMTDSTASVIGGLLQVWNVAAKASIAHRLGADAANASAGLHALRAGAAALGAVAGVANAAGQFARGMDAREDRNHGVMWMYFGSSAAFSGTAVTSGLTFAGALADRQLAKGVSSALIRRMAIRYGAGGVATLLGISVEGWGLLLLGAAVLFEVGAIMLTPTELQEWIKRSYFGGGPTGHKFAKGDWGAEFAALEKLLASPPVEPPSPALLQAEPPARVAGASGVGA